MKKPTPDLNLEELKKKKPHLFTNGSLNNHEFKQFAALFNKDIELKKRKLADMTISGSDTKELVNYIKEAESFYKSFLLSSIKYNTIENQVEMLKQFKDIEEKESNQS